MSKLKLAPGIKEFIECRMRHNTRVYFLPKGRLSFEEERVHIGPFLITEDVDGKEIAGLESGELATDAKEVYAIGGYVLSIYGGDLRKIYHSEYAYHTSEMMRDDAPLLPPIKKGVAA